MLRQFGLLAHPPRFHGLVYLFVDLVSFLITSFLCGTGKKVILVGGPGTSELFRIDIWNFIPPDLHLTVHAGLRVRDGPSKGPSTR